MRYFTDGIDLIRVHTDAVTGSREFFFSDAEKRGPDRKWYAGRTLIIDEILHSGYFYSINVPEE